MKWEYLITGLSDSIAENEKEFDNYGRAGWELVSVTAASETACAIAYFKCPLIEQPAPAPSAPPTDPDTIYVRPESEGGATQ